MPDTTKATPGPWHAEGPIKGEPIFGAVTDDVGDGNMIADCAFHDNPEITRANTRLIAAAWEQHEAAVALDRLSLVIESAVRNADPSQHSVVLAVLQANRAAIAKAENRDA